MTALKSLAFIKGAVFIFAFFKYAIDCIITESPPNPQIKADREMVRAFMFVADKSFNPLVLSIRPKVSAFAVSRFPKKRLNKLIIGRNKLNWKRIDDNI